MLVSRLGSHLRGGTGWGERHAFLYFTAQQNAAGPLGPAAFASSSRSDQAAKVTRVRVRRLRSVAPIIAKPVSISAQLPGSGTSEANWR